LRFHFFLRFVRTFPKFFPQPSGQVTTFFFPPVFFTAGSRSFFLDILRRSIFLLGSPVLFLSLPAIRTSPSLPRPPRFHLSGGRTPLPSDYFSFFFSSSCSERFSLSCMASSRLQLGPSPFSESLVPRSVFFQFQMTFVRGMQIFFSCSVFIRRFCPSVLTVPSGICSWGLFRRRT